jgi:hypothetical protein
VVDLLLEPLSILLCPTVLPYSPRKTTVVWASLGRSCRVEGTEHLELKMAAELGYSVL